MEAITGEKAVRGIGSYLERRGYEILEEGWAHGNDRIDFIADDDGDLVFIACGIRENEGRGFPDDGFDRSAFERIAVAYLDGHRDIPDGEIRFDFISMLVLDGGKALLRHHRNCLGTDGLDAS